MCSSVDTRGESERDDKCGRVWYSVTENREKWIEMNWNEMCRSQYSYGYFSVDAKDVLNDGSQFEIVDDRHKQTKCRYELHGN